MTKHLTRGVFWRLTEGTFHHASRRMRLLAHSESDQEADNRAWGGGFLPTFRLGHPDQPILSGNILTDRHTQRRDMLY